MAIRHVRIGVIGLEDFTADAGLAGLQAQPRLRVSAIWNPSHESTRRAAELLQAHASRSIDSMLARSDVEGLVVLSPGWTGWHSFHFAAAHRVPALLLSSRLADRLFFQEQAVTRLVRESHEANVLLMPGLLMRWTPATIRLRELTATSLGAIESLSVSGETLSLHSRYLADLVDWCCNVIQSAPLSICARHVGDGHGLSRLSVRLTFRRRRSNGEPVQAEVQLRLGLSPVAHAPHLTATAECRHGSCRIRGDRQIESSWEHHTRPETLNTDRSEVDVALDLFGRRIVGGVVPVPDLGDVQRSLQLVHSVVKSLDEDREIPLTPPDCG